VPQNKLIEKNSHFFERWIKKDNELRTGFGCGPTCANIVWGGNIKIMDIEGQIGLSSEN
jgi:hypothetical protein